MHVLVLGGYGLIGLSVVKRLLAEGHAVTGLGRDEALGKRLCPEAEWIEADLRDMGDEDAWRDIIGPAEVVVNAAGALQSGGRDNVPAVQDRAIRALIKACEAQGGRRFVQISAPGVSTASETDFYRSKAAADDALKSSGLDWTILRPGLVISPQAYGGTSLMRMLAAFPMIQPITLPDARIQTVSVDDVAAAVLLAVEARAIGVDADLVEPESHSLEDVTLAFRRWLGFPVPHAVWRVPLWMGKLMAKGADMAGHLGWRSPLRTTAFKVLETGVSGDPQVWREKTGQSPRALSETFRLLPSTVQERIYARMSLLFPVLLLTFSLFWAMSGIIGLVRWEAAAGVLDGVLPRGIVLSAVVLGGLVDIVIGVAALFRRWVRGAAFGAIAVSFGYLGAATIFVPGLWGDPLGPLVKILPALALALTVAAMVEKR